MAKSLIFKGVDRYHYFDCAGHELREGDSVLFPTGEIEVLYLTSDGLLGIDATNPAWIKSGRAAPCEFGIYPLTTIDVKCIRKIF